MGRARGILVVASIEEGSTFEIVLELGVLGRWSNFRKMRGRPAARDAVIACVTLAGMFRGKLASSSSMCARQCRRMSKLRSVKRFEL